MKPMDFNCPQPGDGNVTFHTELLASPKQGMISWWAQWPLHEWEHITCAGKAVTGSCIQRQGRDAGAMEGRPAPGGPGRDSGSITQVGCTNTRHDNG